MKWSVVVPSNRPEKLEVFLKEWDSLFKEYNVNVIPVIDAEPWEGIPDWIPRRTDMIRSWGFWEAFKAGSEFTLSLDDDVLPQGDPFLQYEKAFYRKYPLSEYLSVGGFTTSGLEMRGFPYKDRGKEVVVQYGGWSGVPDLDAVTQILHPRDNEWFDVSVMPVPKKTPITTCAMNFAFRTSWTPIMFQFPLYEGRYNRFGDIWSGLVQKKVLDKLDKVMLINGRASVRHNRASDPFENLKKEAPGLPKNEYLWEYLRSHVGTDQSMIACYRGFMQDLVRYFHKTDKEYADHLDKCVWQWLRLFA